MGERMTNADRWKVARFTKSSSINAQAAKIEAHRDRYKPVSKATGVPWDVNNFASLLR